MLYLILSSIAFVAGVGISYWVHSRSQLEFKVEAELYPDPPYPLISVIVPARNEARNIRRCVEALLAQNYPEFEVIVVDDRSSDKTPHILAELVQTEGDRSGNGRLRVIPGADLPPGWAGKPHALVQGAEAARGEWLCFVDADTFAHPKLLAATYAAARIQRAGMFTILTDQQLASFWEKVILPVVFTALAFGFPARQVNDPDKPDAIANGQFILIQREVYEAIGGHRAVRDRIDEDKALAETVKGDGHRLVLADGRALARTRMYTGLAEIWEGWTKNIFLGMRDRLWLLLFGAVLAFLSALALPLWLVAGLAWFLTTGSLTAGMVAAQAVLLWIYLLSLRVQAARALKISLFYAFTLPLGTLIFSGMMVASAYKVLSGQGVTWKGRTYS